MDKHLSNDEKKDKLRGYYLRIIENTSYPQNLSMDVHRDVVSKVDLAINKILSSSKSEKNKLIQTCEDNLIALVKEMKAVSTQDKFTASDLKMALFKLCPLWPFC